MSAGVGPFSILIAKRTKVWSCELNDAAFKFHVENNGLNKVERRVVMVEGDAMALPEKLAGDGPFDRILMPHPSQSNLFLPAALSMLSPGGVVHYYRHMTGRDTAEASRNLRRELGAVAPRLTVRSVRRVRVIGPRDAELEEGDGVEPARDGLDREEVHYHLDGDEQEEYRGQPFPREERERRGLQRPPHLLLRVEEVNHRVCEAEADGGEHEHRAEV